MVWPGGEQGYGSGGQYPPPGGSGGYGPGGYGSDPYGGGGYGAGGFGGPPGFPPPRRSPTGIIVAVIVVAVVLVGGGVTVAVLASRGHDKHATASGSLGAPSVQPSTQPSAPSLEPPESSPPPAQAKVPGWHAVVSVKHGVTYDVPPGTWVVQSPSMIVGFEDANGKPEVAGSGAAAYKQGYCQGHSGSWRAESAVQGYSTTDLALDAKDAARKWGTFGYTPDSGGSAPTVNVGATTKPIDAGGGVRAQEATANVTVHDPGDPCSPPRGIIHAVAIPLKDGTVSVLIVIADQGVSDAAADADLEKIAGSLRLTA